MALLMSFIARADNHSYNNNSNKVECDTVTFGKECLLNISLPESNNENQFNNDVNLLETAAATILTSKTPISPLITTSKTTSTATGWLNSN